MHRLLLTSASLACLLASPAVAQAPLKIAIVETMSGTQAGTGELFVGGARYGIDLLNAAGGYNGAPIELKIYDNEGTPAGASQKVAAAIADGTNVIIQGTSSAIGSQVTDDVRRHNTRNPNTPVIYINTGAEARDFTGVKCHFYHFKVASDSDIRMNALVKTNKDHKLFGKKVFSINQNYNWGQGMELAIKNYASAGGYTVVDTVLHDVAKIQDFSPFVSRIAASGADTVVTGDWGTDLIRLMKASAEANLKLPFLTGYLDFPGNLSSAGATAEGHVNVDMFNPENGGEKGMALARDFQQKIGAWPSGPQARTMFGVGFLGAGLKLAPPVNGKIDTKAIALAMEKATFETPIGPITMRAEDHQGIVPMAITVVSRKAAMKLEGTDFGFYPVATIPGPDAAVAVQENCKMQRPS